MRQLFSRNSNASSMQLSGRRIFSKWHGLELPLPPTARAVIVPEIRGVGFQVYMKKSKYNRGYKRKHKKIILDIMKIMMSWSYSMIHRFVEVIANASKRIVYALNSEYSHHHSSDEQHKHHAHHEIHQETPKIQMDYKEAA